MKLLALASVLALAACGGSSTPAPADPGNTGEEPGDEAGGREMAPGTTGLPGLSWGASADDVLAYQPRATPDDTGLTYLGMHAGLQAIEHFEIGADGLTLVAIEYVNGYNSMGDCLEAWATMRTELDGKFGESLAENGAAYWDLPAASVTLSCNPNENESAYMSQTHAQRTE